ncbi:MAG: hypothetical protein ABS882_02855 [Lysinibacillus sp.]
MLALEHLLRRLAYTFGSALIVTSGFLSAERIFYLPAITWFVALVLFVLSWRIQKEYAVIILKLDGPDAKPTDPIAWVLGDRMHLYHLCWSAIYTFGTYIVVMLPLDWFIEGTRQWRPYFLVVATIIFVLARLVDKRVRPSFYTKKS